MHTEEIESAPFRVPDPLAVSKAVSYVSFAAQWRSAVDAHRSWIERTVGAPLESSILLQTNLPIDSLIMGKLLGGVAVRGVGETSIPVSRCEFPPERSALLHATPQLIANQEFTRSLAWKSSSVDTPVALWLGGLDRPFVFVPVPFVNYNRGLFSDSTQILVIAQSEVAATLALLA